MDAKQLGDTPAFPCAADGGCGPWPGMTLRQWYAGKIAEGICAANGWSFCDDRLPTFAAGVFKIADALLAEEAKGHA